MPTTLSQSLLPEFDHEMANTRKTLERVPDDRLDWTPHEKSMSMGRLAYHVANIPIWTTLGLTRDAFDLTPDFESGDVTSRDALLALFDQRVTEARRHLAEADDARLMQPWTFKKNGHALFSQPRLMVVRTFVMNHMIHHRGQLSVYLRLNHVPVPGLYGPSADDV